MVRPKIVAFVVAVAIAGACELAHAQRRQTRWTLEVDTDAPDVVSHDTIAEEIDKELGSEGPKVDLVIRYRAEDKTLVVRAKHPGGRVVERTVKAEGDTAAIRKEAVLLAGNVARDEARELLDALAARPPKQPPAAPEPPSAEAAPTPKEAPAPREEELRVLNGGLAYPLSSNFGHPSVTTYFDLSIAFGLVGKVKGMQLGTGGVMAPEVRGVQLAPVTIAEDVEGTQLGVVNIARRVKGAQLGVINIAEDVDGGTLGLVSIHRDAIHPVAWAGNLGYLNAGIAFESKWLYTIVGAQYGTLETGLEPRVGTFGVGGVRGRIVGGLDLGVESSVSSIDPKSVKPDAVNVWFHQRAVVGYRFAKRLRIFVSGGFRAPIAIDEGSHAFRPDFTSGVEF